MDRGESYIQAAERRIKEELGISPPLSKIGNIRVPEEGKYKFSEIYTGDAAGAKNNMPGHVGSLESFDINEVVASYKKDPARFTPSFVYIFGLFLLVYQSELHLE